LRFAKWIGVLLLMCGIFGIIYTDGVSMPDAERLRRSAGVIKHRGPDGSGVHAEPGIGLAHTRLSLLDLDERSNQPFWDQARRYCLIYNGELYNFIEIRKDLEARGVAFRTTSDTEVLLEALIADGPERTLPRLHGMYAFAFYDRATRTLVLARDRFGIKPLNFFRDDERVLFASEVKSMTPWMQLRADRFQVIRYLMSYGAPVRNRGFFDDVEIVPPGALITIERGSPPRVTTFADLPGMVDRATFDELDGMRSDEIVDRVDAQLQASVRRMLFADAPVGALCSGGVDSSVIMAMAARHHSNLAIFHADVVGPLSEFDAASALAKHLKLDLLTVKTHDSDFIELTPDVLYHYEQPFSGHPHSVPFLMVSRLVQQHGVKAVLTGEGADECFLGYNYIAHEPFWAAYQRQIRRLESLVQRIPVIGHLLWEIEGNAPRLIMDALGQFSQRVDEHHARDAYTERMGRAPDKNVRTLDLLAGHLRTLLHRNDRMGMAASIEARFPFLDEDLVATAINLPYRHKIRISGTVWEKEHPFLRDKWVLRRVAERYLPRVLSARKKRGFEVSALFRMQIGTQYFRNSFIADFFRLSENETDLLVNSADQRLKIRLMMLEVWSQLFMEALPVAQVRDRLRRHTSFGAAS
jgi:asparagine synthase (glutamine-hydrolysing)